METKRGQISSSKREKRRGNHDISLILSPQFCKLSHITPASTERFTLPDPRHIQMKLSLAKKGVNLAKAEKRFFIFLCKFSFSSSYAKAK